MDNLFVANTKSLLISIFRTAINSEWNTIESNSGRQ